MMWVNVANSMVVLELVVLTLLTSISGVMLDTGSSGSAERVYLNKWTIKVANGVSKTDVELLAHRYHFDMVGSVGGLPDVYLLRDRQTACGGSDVASLKSKKSKHCRAARDVDREWTVGSHTSIITINQLHEVIRVRKQDFQLPQDPMFNQQWYYHTSLSSTPHNNINVYPVWEQNITGAGVVVCIVDDGIEYDHPDLRHNYDANASYDFNDDDADAYPDETKSVNNHGTRCAGVVASRFDNNYCGVGVAYNVGIGGVRMLDGLIDDAVEANSLGYNPDHIDIYTNSWGPTDNGQTMERPGPLATAVLEQSTKHGRSGLGNIFLFASGNGGSIDDCNCDGYASSIHTIAVSAISRSHTSLHFVENCAAAITSGYSKGADGAGLVTVDVNKQCTANFGGTSAASPLVAGIIALMLEANTLLTWRDVQHVVIHGSDPMFTATTTTTMSSSSSEASSDWAEISEGLWHHHLFGFGRLNAGKAVFFAKHWQPVGQQITSSFATADLNQHLDSNADDDKTLGQHNISFDVTATQTPITYIEHVQVRLNVVNATEGRGFVRVMLECPNGVESLLLRTRKYDTTHRDLPPNWTVMTVRCWGQRAEGVWRLRIVCDRGATIIVNATLVLYGTRVAPVVPIYIAPTSSPTLEPLPTTTTTTTMMMKTTALLDQKTPPASPPSTLPTPPSLSSPSSSPPPSPQTPSYLTTSSTIASSDSTLAPPVVCFDTGKKFKSDLKVKIKAIMRHDTSSFTEGLFIHRSVFYESAGLYRQSKVKKFLVLDVDDSISLQTPLTSITSAKIDAGAFGEGLTKHGHSLFLLTYKKQQLLEFDFNKFDTDGILEKKRTHTYIGQGWGLTSDGASLIMSNGSSTITFRDADNFEILRSITVRLDSGLEVRRINELEYIGDKIWANIWFDERLLVINADTGLIEHVIEAGSILRQTGIPCLPEQTLNGIAYDKKTRMLWLTGKDWPSLFAVDIDFGETGFNTSSLFESVTGDDDDDDKLGTPSHTLSMVVIIVVVVVVLIVVIVAAVVIWRRKKGPRYQLVKSGGGDDAYATAMANSVVYNPAFKSPVVLTL